MVTTKKSQKQSQKFDAIVLTFTAERETKNTIRYAEDERDGEAPVIGTLYIQKHAKTPQQITVTIAAS